MEISEEGWAKIGAEVALHEQVLVLLVRASPLRDDIVSAVRQIGEGVWAGLLGSKLSDIHVDQFGKTLQRFLRTVEDPAGANRK
jgi:hypothetical protein